MLEDQKIAARLFTGRNSIKIIGRMAKQVGDLMQTLPRSLKDSALSQSITQNHENQPKIHVRYEIAKRCNIDHTNNRFSIPYKPINFFRAGFGTSGQDVDLDAEGSVNFPGPNNLHTLFNDFRHLPAVYNLSPIYLNLRLFIYNYNKGEP